MAVIDISDITKTPYDITTNQLGNDEVEIGSQTCTLVDRLYEEGMGPEVNVFFDHVRLFYTTLVKKLIEKLPSIQPFCQT